MPILLPGQLMDEAEVRKIFDQLGPTPRIIKLLSDPDKLYQYKGNVDVIISGITPDDIEKLVRDIGSLSMPAGLSKQTWSPSPSETHVMYSPAVVEPIT